MEGRLETLSRSGVCRYESNAASVARNLWVNILQKDAFSASSTVVGPTFESRKLILIIWDWIKCDLQRGTKRRGLKKMKIFYCLTTKVY